MARNTQDPQDAAIENAAIDVLFQLQVESLKAEMRLNQLLAKYADIAREILNNSLTRLAADDADYGDIFSAKHYEFCRATYDAVALKTDADAFKADTQFLAKKLRDEFKLRRLNFSNADVRAFAVSWLRTGLLIPAHLPHDDEWRKDSQSAARAMSIHPDGVVPSERTQDAMRHIISQLPGFKSVKVGRPKGAKTKTKSKPQPSANGHASKAEALAAVGN